ncbi:MAG: helix-turn-helix transcriptional regulator [Spirochaetales bacterium]|nr:helix-turn-helix transcriptional regulator [Spirochaetales bacterium]
MFNFFSLEKKRKTFQHATLSDKVANLGECYNLTEKEICVTILEEKTNKIISEELFISIKTMKSHIYSIFQKMDIKSRNKKASHGFIVIAVSHPYGAPYLEYPDGDTLYDEDAKYGFEWLLPLMTDEE